MEMSALCSNLSKGCEKQYRTEEANSFNQLSEYFKCKSNHAEDGDFEDLRKLIKKDLDLGYTNANGVAADNGDRGALRALVWSEKATKILNTILSRYKKIEMHYWKIRILMFAIFADLYILAMKRRKYVLFAKSPI